MSLIEEFRRVADEFAGRVDREGRSAWVEQTTGAVLPSSLRSGVSDAEWRVLHRWAHAVRQVRLQADAVRAGEDPRVLRRALQVLATMEDNYRDVIGLTPMSAGRAIEGLAGIRVELAGGNRRLVGVEPR